MSISLKLFSNKLKKKIYLTGIAIKIDRKKDQCIDRWKDNQTGERERARWEVRKGERINPAFSGKL